MRGMKNIKKGLFVFIILLCSFFAFSSYLKADNSKTKDLETYNATNDYEGNLTCNDLFGNKNDAGSVMSIISEVYKIAKIVAVIMVIVLSMMDFTKAVASSDSDILRKTFNVFIKRLIILMSFFLIPGFIKLIFDFVFGEGTMCSM